MTDPSLPREIETTTAVLRHFNWTPVSKVPGKYEVWSDAARLEEILIPLNPESGDYEALVSRAARMIGARFGGEGRKVQELLNLRTLAALDSTRWSKDTTVDAGLIPWSEGEKVFASARDSLVASVRSVYARRLRHGRSGSYLAQAFLDKTFMGQTEIGSFVVTAHTPANERFHVRQASANLPPDEWRKTEQVSGRTIIDAFVVAVEAVRDGLDEYKKAPTIDTFVPLAQEGVSYELVQALASLTSGGDAAIRIEHHSEGTDKPFISEVTFDAVEAPVLAQVADRFSDIPPPQKVTIVGEVSLLDNSSTSPVHLVRLDVMTGAEVRRARVRLSPEQYELAVQAHLQHQWLRVNGTLEKDGRDYWLYNVGEVVVTAADDGPQVWPTVLFDSPGFDLSFGSDDDDPPSNFPFMLK